MAVDVIACRERAPFFPSPDRPILDESLVGQDKGEPAMHYMRVEGFAADGVAAIRLLNATGNVIGTAIVNDNVYSLDAMPTEPVTSIAAVDAAGQVLATYP